MIPFKMMYNWSMLHHRFSNEWGGGGGAALNHLSLLFCKSVYFLQSFMVQQVAWLLRFRSGYHWAQVTMATRFVAHAYCFRKLGYQI